MPPAPAAACCDACLSAAEPTASSGPQSLTETASHLQSSTMKDSRQTLKCGQTPVHQPLPAVNFLLHLMQWLLIIPSPGQRASVHSQQFYSRQE